MGLSERKTPPYQTQEASTAPEYPRTKNDHVRAALSPRVRLTNAGRSAPQCPCERTRSSSTLPIYLPTTHRCSHTQSCMQASPSGLSDRSATNKSHISPNSRAAKKADLTASDPSLRRRLIRGGRQREKRESPPAIIIISQHHHPQIRRPAISS